MNDYIIGSICAITQNVVGYPFDTFKVRFQSSSVPLKSCTSSLFSGISGPMICNTLTTGLNYGIFNDLEHHFQNSLVSGFISGGILAPIVNIGENYKIKRQLGIFPKNYINIRRGLGLCTIRDSFGCSIYFGMYMNLPSEWGSFINGGIAGASSWLFTYPIDTVKTRIQANDLETISSSISKGGIFRGVGFCLARAFLVNASSFFVYDKLKSISYD